MPDNTNDNAKEVKDGSIPSLDEVNDLTQAKLDKEAEDASAAESEDKKDEAATGSDDKAEDGDDLAATGNESDKEEADSDKAEEPDNPEPAPELDTEITKPGKDKVSIKAFDGKTYYFNNFDEVPNDFEPENYKALMAGTRSLLQKEEADAKAERKANRDEQAKAQKARTDAMQESWDKDIKELKLEDAQVEEVYTYMEDQLKDGVPIENFKLAYKAMAHDKSEAEDQAKLNDIKKKRGGQVQAGGTPPPNKPTVREAPPRGVGLDAVHQHALQNL